MNFATSTALLAFFPIAVALIGHAIHQQSAGLGLAAGCMLSFCVTAAYLLSGVGQLQTTHWIRLAQINALSSGCFAIGWMIYLKVWRPDLRDLAWNNPLVTQVGLAAGFASLFVLPTTVGLFWNPDAFFAWEQAAGSCRCCAY